MNDFTKQELIDLEETYTWICEEYSQPDSDYVLRDKLREMIANYCEHESYEENIVTGIVCSQCGEPWNE